MPEYQKVEIVKTVSAPLSPVGQTMIHNRETAVNGAATLRTVTAGKIFYIVHLQLTIHSTGDLSGGSIYIGAEIVLNLFANITATYKTSDSQNINYSPAVPVPVPAGTIIKVESGDALTTASGMLSGWEEDE